MSEEPLTEWLVCPKCSYKSPYSPIKAKTLAEDAERITKQTRAALAQPKRKWVGLTDDELLKTYGWEFESYGQSDRPSLGPSILDESKQEIINGLRKVEAKLKEKNHE